MEAAVQLDKERASAWPNARDLGAQQEMAAGW